MSVEVSCLSPTPGGEPSFHPALLSLTWPCAAQGEGALLGLQPAGSCGHFLTAAPALGARLHAISVWG